LCWLYVSFQVTGFVSKALFRALGLLLDGGKQGTGIPAYYVGEIAASLCFALY